MSRIVFAVKCQPNLESRKGCLVKFLKESNDDLRDAVFETLEMCWMPLAMRGVEGADVEREAWQSIQALLDQIRLIANVVELDEERLSNLIKSRFSQCSSSDSEAIVEALKNLNVVAVDEGDRQSKSDPESQEVSDEEFQDLMNFCQM